MSDLLYPGSDFMQTTKFGELITAEFTPIIELDSSNGLSTALRDTTTETNGGTVTNSNGEFVLSTSTTTSSVAGLRSKERGRYQPGIVGLPGVAVRLSADPTGDQECIWGYFDGTDGVWAGWDSTGPFLRYRHNGTTDDKIYQGDWNGADPLDGEGLSGVDLSSNKTAVWRFPFVWYGGGPIEVWVQTQTNDGQSVYAQLHSFPGPDAEAVFGNPKLPVNAEARNGSTATDIKMYVGGRQFAVIGRYDPNYRNTPEYRTGVTVAAGATEPIVSFRKKSDRTSATKSVKISTASVLSDQDGILKVYLGASLTSESFGSVSEVADSETAVEADTSADAITGGTLIKARVVDGGAGAMSAGQGANLLDIDLPENTIVTLAFENTSVSSASVNGVLEVEEEW